MTLPIYQVDAFASAVFKGNPAAVMPLPEWLPAETMQLLAMENNLAETAFFVPVDSKVAHYHLRWFTPGLEIDLCGHATVAAAFVIHHFINPSLSTICFTTEKAGLLKVHIANGLFTLDFPARMPQPLDDQPLLYKALGVENVVAVLQSRDYFVVLESEDAVRNLKPDMAMLKQLDKMGVIVTAKGETSDAVCRCFFPKAGVDEDPVTGSAHCNVVPYWSQQLNKTRLVCRQISQRGGEIIGEQQGERVLLSGQAVLYMKGEVYLSERT